MVPPALLPMPSRVCVLVRSPGFSLFSHALLCGNFICDCERSSLTAVELMAPPALLANEVVCPRALAWTLLLSLALLRNIKNTIVSVLLFA